MARYHGSHGGNTLCAHIRHKRRVERQTNAPFCSAVEEGYRYKEWWRRGEVLWGPEARVKTIIHAKIGEKAALARRQR